MKRGKSDIAGVGAWLDAAGRAQLGEAACARVQGWLAAAGPVDPALESAVVEVLVLLQGLGADADMALATLLHRLPGLREAAGEAVLREPGMAALIEGQRAAGQVWNLHGGRSAAGNAEGLRRLLLAIVRDLRVIPILLADQLVRLRHADALPRAEAQALARLTADIHAPLANRLGIWQLKWELEDLAFRHLQPDTYKRIARLLDEKRGDRERFIEEAKARIAAALAEQGIEADIAGRPKHIFSIWKKMQRKGVPFSELYDVRAVRVLVRDLATCYAVLGIVHSLWTPVPAEFDDYIAKPKGNDYRSLHTAVVGPEGKTLEVQIRTFDMHEHAELGVAAHWRYKEGGGADAAFERKIAWMRQLLEGREGEEESSLLAGLKSDLIEDRVYLLTPKGQVIDLPRGGTVLDFAYHVHTEVGNRCRGAKVNGRIVPLNFQPKSGDHVEIMTSKQGEPRRDWLLAANGFLASARARDKVRAWFHRLDRERNVAEGREHLERELKRLVLHHHDLAPILPRFRVASVEDLYVAVALGDVGPSQVARALHEQAQGDSATDAAGTTAEPGRPESRVRPARPSDRFTVEGVGNLLTQLARCCQPVAGDPIVGYLTRGRGVSIHREGCTAFERLAARNPERALPVEWGQRGGSSYSVDVVVSGVDRKWLLKDLTTLIAQGGAHVLSMNTRTDDGKGVADIRFTLKVSDFEQLGQLLGKLGAVPGVHEARRVS